MSNSHEAMSNALATEDQLFQNKLSSYTILDLCILESVAKTSAGVMGVLRSSRVSADGSVPRYTNVELLNIGSSKGGFTAGGDSEDLYLVFCPASPMMSSITRQIDTKSSGAYSASGMKALPVASMLGWVSSAGFDRSGNFILRFPGSSLAFNVDSSISYQHQGILKLGKNADGSIFIDILAGRYQFFLMSDTSWYKCLWGSDGKIQEILIHAIDGTETERRWSTSAPTNEQKKSILTFTPFLYEKVTSPDGVVTILHRNSGGSIIAEDTLSAGGSKNIKGTNVVISSISAGGTPKTVITLDDKIAIKNALQDFLALWDELIDCAVGIGTVGGSSAQSIDPASIAQFEALRLKIHNLIAAG